MSESIVRAFVEQATQALQAGQPGQALELADQALGVDHSSADATLVRAIALSQLLRVDEATATFEQAQQKDPSSARASYNFAVHLQSVGNLARAREEAERALRQTPNHAGARQLLALIDQQESARTETAFAETQQANEVDGPPVMGYMQPGYDAPEHTLRWVERIAPQWTTAGWVLACLSLGYFILYVAVSYQGFYQIVMKGATNFQPSGLGGEALTILYIPIMVAVISWTVIDLLDRRANGFWLVPMIVCCCCISNWIPMLLYMATGRNRRVR